MSALVILALADGALWIGVLLCGMAITPLGGMVHIGLCVWAMTTMPGQSGNLRGWDRLAWPIGAVIGPCAILALAALRPWTRIAPRRNPHLVACSETPEPGDLAPNPATGAARILDGHIRIPDADRVQSLTTILRHGCLEDRLRTLETIVRSLEPSLSPLVAMALADPDQTMRALAASVSARVSASTSEQVSALEVAAADNVDKRYALAMLLCDHGQNNVLLSESQREEYRRKARSNLMALMHDTELDRRRLPRVADSLFQISSQFPGDAVVGIKLPYHELEREDAV